MHQFHFLIPDPVAFPSGGNVYNANLIRSLIHAGVHISQSAFQPGILMLSPDTLYILDSIYFAQIDRPQQQIPPRCIGLIHHLESLFPLSEERFYASEQPILDCFSAFLVTSTFTADNLISHGYDPKQVTIIEPAPTLQRKPAAELKSQVHALMLGSCIPRKGQLALLQSLQDADIPPSYTLTIAGSLTADAMYARQCAELILKNANLRKCVRLLGEQDATAIQQLYDRANLFISSSWMETFGMAIQDAVVSGMPVLALDHGYAAEHIAHGSNGYRCKTIDELVDHFRKCVADTIHFATLQKQALLFTPRYHTWEDAAGKLIQAFAR